MQVVDALIKADKDFDLVVIPGAGHGAAGTPYGTRRQLDFSPSTWSRRRAFPASRLRPLDVVRDGVWIGNAISYGPYRDGQRPVDRIHPTPRFSRTCGSWPATGSSCGCTDPTGPTEAIVRLIDAHDLDLQVMVGAWIAPEVRLDAAGAVVAARPELRADNRNRSTPRWPWPPRTPTW